MSNRSVTMLAGIGLSPSRMAWICGRSSWPSWSGVAASGTSASRNRCWRSTVSSRSVLATASSTWTLARIGRPCSSQVYQVTPTPASCATSSRRSPAVRRRCPPGSPTSSGVIRSRRLRKNAASSSRRSTMALFPARSTIPLARPSRSLDHPARSTIPLARPSRSLYHPARSTIPLARPSRSPPGRFQGVSFPPRSFLARQSKRRRGPSARGGSPSGAAALRLAGGVQAVPRPFGSRGESKRCRGPSARGGSPSGPRPFGSRGESKRCRGPSARGGSPSGAAALRLAGGVQAVPRPFGSRGESKRCRGPSARGGSPSGAAALRLAGGVQAVPRPFGSRGESSRRRGPLARGVGQSAPRPSGLLMFPSCQPARPPARWCQYQDNQCLGTWIRTGPGLVT